MNVSTCEKQAVEVTHARVPGTSTVGVCVDGTPAFLSTSMEIALYGFLENMRDPYFGRFCVVGLEILRHGFQKPFRCIADVDDRVSS